MSKEATIIQSFNDLKRQYEYFVKGYDVTESVKILLKRHKEEYDKEKKIFAGIDGCLEAQKEYQSQIVDLEAKLAEKEKILERIMSGEYIPANIAEKSLELSNQYKISFAVEQLEKARKLVDELLDNCGDKQYKVWEVFDNKIKQLEEVMKGE